MGKVPRKSHGNSLAEKLARNLDIIAGIIREHPRINQWIFQHFLCCTYLRGDKIRFLLVFTMSSTRYVQLFVASIPCPAYILCTSIDFRLQHFTAA